MVSHSFAILLHAETGFFTFSRINGKSRVRLERASSASQANQKKNPGAAVEVIPAQRYSQRPRSIAEEGWNSKKHGFAR
jgi:hypothetical protein